MPLELSFPTPPFSMTCRGSFLMMGLYFKNISNSRRILLGNDVSDFFPLVSCKLINVFLYLAENDVHSYLRSYFACDPWNYPSNNIVIATMSQEPFILGVRPHLQQMSLLPFHEWILDIVTRGIECRLSVSEFKEKTQQNVLFGEKSRMDVMS